MAGGHAWQGACMAGEGGMHGRGACMAGGCVWLGCMVGGMCGRGHVWQGACVVGGMCGGGDAWQGGHAWWWWGVCMPHMPPPPPTLRDMVGQCAGGTHPTGMHSCYLIVLHESETRVTVQFEHRNKSKKRSIQWSILFL